MLITDSLIKSVLLEAKVSSIEDITLLEKSAKAQGVNLHEYVSEANILPQQQLGQFIAEKIGFPYIDLSHIKIPIDILNIIPEYVARKRYIIAFKKDEKGWHIATSQPGDLSVVNFIRKKLGDKVIIYYTTKKSLEEALSSYAKDISIAFEDVLAENIKSANKSSKPAELSIIKIVDTIIEYAFKNKASDVHLEPENDHSLLRFRIDGVLHDIVRLPIKIHDQLITRIKVMSNLRIDTRHIAQDGKIFKKIYDKDLNLRVSIVPITRGEKVVLRLLSEDGFHLTLKELGLNGGSLEKMQKAYKKPYGMILATGPTGAGKTTSLYAILKDINTRDINIMTIEDPVEFDIENISQIQVNPKVGLTFATGLRSIVRQDPDVILVGEIRDEETAKIAVNSAMTGHLVLSTLHTNDAATTVPRLLDMGVEPFLIASSVNVIVGQRLVRRVCEECRTSKQLTEQEIEKLKGVISFDEMKRYLRVGNEGKSVTVYYGKGCDVCNNTGYRSRIGIYEVLEVNDEIRSAVIAKSNASEIAQIAIKNGMTTMRQDGLEKVSLGITTVEELVRAIEE
jgi:type IV pilus assembly protein PilB